MVSPAGRQRQFHIRSRQATRCGFVHRVHGTVTEFDARRLFYSCGEDEVSRYAMQSLYKARKAIRDATKGVWASPSCEPSMQDISAALSSFCTRAEKLDPKPRSPMTVKAHIQRGLLGLFL